MQHPTEELQTRLYILTAVDYAPEILTYRRAFATYLESAFECGMFDGDSGADLRARLAGRDDENFLSGITECLTAWFLTRRLGLAVTPRPAGKGCSILEFAIGAPDGDILVEVKAPRRPVARAIAGGPVEDVDIIRRAIRQANRQFRVGRRNLLVIVPKLITFLFPLYEFLRRDIALRALIGESTIRVPIDLGTGGPAGAPTGGFRGRIVQAEDWWQGEAIHAR